jgi:hypothetical protein
MHPQLSWLDDGVIGRAGALCCPARDLMSAAVLRSAVQRHEPYGRAKDALLLDARQGEELGQVHFLRLASPSQVALENPPVRRAGIQAKGCPRRAEVVRKGASTASPSSRVTHGERQIG